MVDPTITITSWVDKGPTGWRGYASDRGQRLMYPTGGGDQEAAVVEAKRESDRIAGRYLGDWDIRRVDVGP